MSVGRSVVHKHISKHTVTVLCKSQTLLKRISLKNILWGIIKLRFKKQSTLILRFPHEKTIKLRLSFNDFMNFLSASLHIANYPLIFQKSISQQKINCDTEGGIDPGFETSLIQFL